MYKERKKKKPTTCFFQERDALTAIRNLHRLTGDHLQQVLASITFVKDTARGTPQLKTILYIGVSERPNPIGKVILFSFLQGSLLDNLLLIGHRKHLFSFTHSTFIYYTATRLSALLEHPREHYVFPAPTEHAMGLQRQR